MTLTNPLHNGNRLKLGIFGINGHGNSMTLLPHRHSLTWDWMVRVAQRADAAGFEAIVPFARWKMGAQRTSGADSDGVYEPYVWAAGLGQATRYSAILATSHVPTIHPIVAAKQAATIDQITHGRFALNVVAGWNAPEFAMFGARLKEHDARYDQAAEWLTVVRRLWTERDEFDHEGASYRIVRGESDPKPVQKPYPPIMNAGGSGRGREFAAEFADLCFIIARTDNPADIAQDIAAYRNLAGTRFRRSIAAWTYAYVIQRASQDEAETYEQYLFDHVNERSLEFWLRQQREQSQLMSDEALVAMTRRWVCGSGGFRLVGTAESIAAKLEALSAAGLDGLLLTWIDYEDGLERWASDVMPRIEAAGLRQAFSERERSGGC